jgi:hypothetical protein
MLNPTEKERLKGRDNLAAKTKANLDYRVAKKIETRLSEIREINEVLGTIPEKTARKVIKDDMISAVFQLSENLIRILRYAPIVVEPNKKYVSIWHEAKSKKENVSEAFSVEHIEPTKTDEARNAMLKRHVERLGMYLDPTTANQPPITRLTPASKKAAQPIISTEAYSLMRGWDYPW